MYSVTFVGKNFTLVTTIEAANQNEAINKAGNNLLATYGWTVYEASTSIVAELLA
jgi:hypothetical protein